MSEDIVCEFARQQGYSEAAVAAGREADRRVARLSHPRGRFDNAGRFFLAERCDCCTGIRTPSLARPSTEMLHGRSITHVAHLYRVPSLHVRRLAKAFDLARRCSAASHHSRAQFVVRLARILKPLPSER